MSASPGCWLMVRQFSTSPIVCITLRSWSSGNLSCCRRGAEWESLDVLQIILAAIFWIRSSFVRWLFATGLSIPLAYSKWLLMSAIYASLRRLVDRNGAALRRTPKSPWHFLTTVLMCSPRVRCLSRITHSNFTVVSGRILQPSRTISSSAGSFLFGLLKIINWVLDAFIESSRSLQNFLVEEKVSINLFEIISTSWPD